ncbi:MAG: 4Fe-4S dicluster domain-containing protein [Coriobacteriales bacterium]|jgi:anaerobic dimethyl sulfoxide reductase subunit B (iron-sulfur subunit)|nr:4Fe-4S dicluster domain-containing protein [Coriobacteriales bacterium]
MEQKGFLFDQNYCIGCQTCVSACRARHGIRPGTYPRKATSSQVQIVGPFLSVACNHCDVPACTAVCPTGAVQKREADGIVTHDAEVCIGCYSCVSACPYDAPQQNEINNKMVKCDLCAARLDGDDVPACVLSCPLKVLSVGTISEFEAEGAVKEGVGFTMHGNGPNLRFVGR